MRTRKSRGSTGSSCRSTSAGIYKNANERCVRTTGISLSRNGRRTLIDTLVSQRRAPKTRKQSAVLPYSRFCAARL